MLLLYAVALGLIAGLVTGGKLAALATVKFRLWPLALGGLAFQLLLFSSPLAGVVGDLGPALYVVSTAVVLGALLANVRQPGFYVIVVGALLNLVVIVANGGQMPASAEAVAQLAGTALVPASGFTNSVIAGENTVLGFLGDNLVLPRPLPMANVFSIGDVMIGLGGAWFIVRTMHRPLRVIARPGPAPAVKARVSHG